MSLDVLSLQGAIALGLLIIQTPAALILLSRLLKGATRHPPIQPQHPIPEMLGAVSVVVPTLNEAERINPCLAGLSEQGGEVREIIIVDSNSQDGTRDVVKAAQEKDSRIRLMTDDPLPVGWVGRPWALHNGFLASSEQSKWVLGIDADTQPRAGLVAGLLKVAEAEGYDLVSLSPRFILKYPGEWWLQPALLLTLVYRFGPTGDTTQTSERVMANGQCFLCRRTVLKQLGGYNSARTSFCDDVTLARNAAAAGFKVGFLDGAKVIKVRMYEGAVETWKEWGRSLDLKDASNSGQLWGDLWLLLSVQGLPLPASVLLFSWLMMGTSATVMLAAGLNLFLLTIRVALLGAIAPSYDFSPPDSQEQKVKSQEFPFYLCVLAFCLSPLAYPLAFLRICLSTFSTPTQWRGRSYAQIQS